MDLLRKRGHTVVEFANPLDMQKVVRIAMGMLQVDNMELVNEAYQGERVPSYAQKPLLLRHLGNNSRRLLRSIFAKREPRVRLLVTKTANGLEYLKVGVEI